jgi:calcineurin-like phosphoesterase family protein
MIFYTSDTHFGHSNIIKYCKRPYQTVEEMDEDMIRRWNSVVGRNDTVYHLGDFAFKNADAVSNYLRRLHGHIHLVWGNHDSNQTRKLPAWASSQPYLEIKDGTDFIVLSHYGHRVWNRSHHGSLMLYGHSHGTLPGNSQSLDVGADCWDLTPITLQQIKTRLQTLPNYTSEDRH